MGEYADDYLAGGEEDYSYCQYCDEPNPSYERGREETNCVSGLTRVTVYVFCDEDCADKWFDR